MAYLPPHPPYFRFLTLMAFHTFLKLNVDVAVVEVGIGGEYDATNIMPSPIVTAITSLGYDHQSILGNSIESIAWNKAGIFKPGAIAFVSSPQPLNAWPIVEKRAEEKHVTIHKVEAQDLAKYGIEETHKLGIHGTHQRINAAVSVNIADTWLRIVRKISLQDHQSITVKALENTQWPGRSQILRDINRSDLEWFLDGAHTTESIQVCCEWFGDELKQRYIREYALVFNCTRGRDQAELLRVLSTCLQRHQLSCVHAAFCTNVTLPNGKFQADLYDAAVDIHDLTVQKFGEQMWKGFEPSTTTSIHASITEALDHIQEIKTAKNLCVLVTGSLHLVGGVLSILHYQID